MHRVMRDRRTRSFSAALAVMALVGCTSISTTNTPRTSTEQLLISNAIDGALDKINFTPFAGTNVYLEEKYVEGVDSKYLIASVRHRVLHAGARLVSKPDEADVVLELRNGGIGTASQDSYVGTPQIGIPGMVSLPEVKLLERKRQQGAAKIGLVAYDSRTGEILGEGGITLSHSDDSNWYLAGVGPWRTGSIRNEIEQRTSGTAAVRRQVLPESVVFEGPRRRSSEDPAAEEVRHAAFPAAGESPSR
jgi:hypothetical protein